MNPEAQEWLQGVMASLYYPQLARAMKSRARYRNDPKPTSHEQEWCSGYSEGFKDYPELMMELAFEGPVKSTDEFTESLEPDFANQEPNAKH